jgi:hypothetical protein
MWGPPGSQRKQWRARQLSGAVGTLVVVTLGGAQRATESAQAGPWGRQLVHSPGMGGVVVTGVPPEVAQAVGTAWDWQEYAGVAASVSCWLPASASSKT